MPNIVIAQADAPAGAQIETQVQDLINEIQVPGDLARDAVSAPLDALSPIVFFLAVAAVFCVKYYFAHRAKQEVQTTVRAALERGVPLTGELLERFAGAPPPKGTDLRRGMISIGLGVGLGVFGLVIGNAEAVRPMLAIGLVPTLLGVAYLVLWRLSEGKG